MSLELCAHIAYAEGWPLFGLQYGQECWACKCYCGCLLSDMLMDSILLVN